MRNNEKIKYAAMTAMFAALITITTAYVKIPAPLGYAHAGDSMIYLSASVLPGPLGFAAAAIGGGLADSCGFIGRLSSVGCSDSNYKSVECTSVFSVKVFFKRQSEA